MGPQVQGCSSCGSRLCLCVSCVKHASRTESIIVASMFRHLLLKHLMCTYMSSCAILIFYNAYVMFCFDRI